LRRDLRRTPSDCRPHLAASPRTHRLPVGHQPIDWLAHSKPVRLLWTKARPPARQPCLESSGAALAMRGFGLPPSAALSYDRFGAHPYSTLTSGTRYPVFRPISKPCGRRPPAG
jgi:hypothetical protein